MRLRLATVVLVLLTAPGLPGSAAAQASPQKAQQDKARSRVDAQRFLLFGTVFTPPGLAMPGARIEVRRAAEKKVRWRATSDRRGEFAVRVPPDAEYEVTVKAKGFETMTRKVDATSGVREDMVFRMTASPGGKK